MNLAATDEFGVGLEYLDVGHEISSLASAEAVDQIKWMWDMKFLVLHQLKRWIRSNQKV